MPQEFTSIDYFWHSFAPFSFSFFSNSFMHITILTVSFCHSFLFTYFYPLSAVYFPCCSGLKTLRNGTIHVWFWPMLSGDALNRWGELYSIGTHANTPYKRNQHRNISHRRQQSAYSYVIAVSE